MLKYAFLLLALLCATMSGARAEGEKVAFWDQQREGANMMNMVPTEAQFAAAEKLGLQYVRLAVDKWKPAGRDFLIGSADHYDGLNQTDLAKLHEVLGWAEKHHVKVVVTLLSLPGSRWRQLNGDKDDLRLWQDVAYQDQASAFWRDLAVALKDEPAVVGYNILNEPHPEKLGGFDEDGARDFAGWYRKAKGTPRDLNAFYTKAIAAIRTVDGETPVMIDSGLYGAPDAFSYLAPQADDKVLYAFHMYEPYAFTSPKNKGRYVYPGKVPFAGRADTWDADAVGRYLSAAAAWQAKHGVPANRIVGAEFGCFRQNKGCGPYLADVIAALNAQTWHWAFYAFREDSWDGMDYEIGTGKLPWKYWQDIEAGNHPEPPRGDNPLFDVIKREFGTP